MASNLEAMASNLEAMAHNALGAAGFRHTGYNGWCQWVYAEFHATWAPTWTGVFKSAPGPGDFKLRLCKDSGESVARCLFMEFEFCCCYFFMLGANPATSPMYCSVHSKEKKGRDQVECHHARASAASFGLLDARDE